MARREAADDPHPNDDLLIAFHDNVLFPGDRPAVEQHLQTCERCRVRLATLVAVSASEAPANTTPPAPRRTDVARPRRRSGPSILGRGGRAALLIAVVVAGGWLLQRELFRRADEPVSLASPPAAPASAAPPAPVDLPSPAAAPDVAASPPDAAPPVASVEVISPDRNFRWRVVGPEVARSTDGGVVWQPQKVAVTHRIVAGTAPSASVCWLVGDNGAVLIGVGTDWKNVSLPQPAALVTVAALDSMNATVTTADGRQFSTGDQGATWNLVP